ncbi:glucose 1-dehydrogenase [Brevibacillus choshinensis]|uniref:SDR family NAD(P)-dependent oxidoreductase n=1 Tax=Brevibacillus choshinensis TaxID=54911 RepID=UPI002E2383E1|nr:glucose 1-dehydrogenase [Brevibacillus choshinensis]MED4586425.1 SDR family oxidoreductase [Brevibacillus choshinensis]MED4754350.1 SDR family oxidoreductase [Brevibacillus choshinensis]MED4782551.1 SDR family oxidoreductase [Brevibacillus choshinensis]
MKFKDNIVIVTGAGNGIGRAVATMYATQGAHVVIAEQNREAGESAAHSINASEITTGTATFQQVDVSQPDHIVQLMQMVDERWGRLDVLINNAGLSTWESPYDLTVEAWDHILNTNLRSVFLGSREAAKVMRKHGGGSIVNLSSSRAHMSEPNSEAYAASKGGILALTHALAVSLGTDGIRVNAISPGWIENGDYSALRPEDHAQHPAGRVGVPDDIARACLFLTQKDNDFITGTELVIDGGMTRKMIYEP